MEAESKKYFGPTAIARELDIDPRTARKLMVEFADCEVIRGTRLRVTRAEAERLIDFLKNREVER